jgi:uncharacterized protein with GYD domain
MPKYLAVASYTSEGIKGLTRAGGVSRRAVVEKLLKSLGGRLEAFYFAFGENDAYLILDVPDNLTAAAISLAVAGAGASQGVSKGPKTIKAPGSEVHGKRGGHFPSCRLVVCF